MSWSIKRIDPNMSVFISKKRLALTKDGKVVDWGHVDADRLLIHEGGEMPLEDAKRYGLVDDKPLENPVIPQPEPAAIEQREDRTVKTSGIKRR